MKKYLADDQIQNLRALAASYFQERLKNSGVVVAFQGEVAGWMSELRDPHKWEPGAFAVDVRGRVWTSVFGNSQDGALFWLPVVEEEKDLVRILDSTELVSGKTSTTTIGYVNRNNQRNLGTRGILGTDHQQLVYKLQCMNPGCGHLYGANGSDVFQRRCPKCQDGSEGLDY